MNQPAEQESLEFFNAMHQVFSRTLANYQGREQMLGLLLRQAFSCYEGNAEMQSKELPEPDCHKGCATCCSIRVVATAPEVLLVARFIRAKEGELMQEGIDLRQRLAKANEVTQGHDDQQRVSLRRRCPFIYKGGCTIYSIRPLACRSHLSFSKQACLDAATGRLDEIPCSEPHMTLRSLIQNAMQSALRDADYPWATYELNHALSIALADDGAEDAWLAGRDPFESALVADVGLDEMAYTFDQVHRRAVL